MTTLGKAYTLSPTLQGVPDAGKAAGPPRSHTTGKRVLARVLAGSVLGALTLVSSTSGYLEFQPNTAAAVTDEEISLGGALSEVDHHRVAPGLELSTFSRLESAG